MNKQEAYIYLNGIELNDLMKYYSHVNKYCKTFEFDSYWLIVDEATLSKILYHLSHDHYLRPRLQKAGDLVFKWDRGM